MIKHHPSLDWLNQYANGTLPASISSAVAIHTEYCPQCREKVRALEAEQASNLLSADRMESASQSEQQNMNRALHIDLDSMLDGILANDEIETAPTPTEKHFNVANNTYKLPRALHNVAVNGFHGLGKISRSKINYGEGEIHSHLLHIDANGRVPSHTHNGFELTLLLEGTFSDSMGDYVPGDFILLDGEHNHQPETKEGCLCFTVVSDSLHFTEGLSKLLNPIGHLIY